MTITNVIGKYSRQLTRFVTNNSPSILTVFGVAGLVGTVIMAVRATHVAEEILYQEAKYRREDWSKQTGEDESSYPIDPIIPVEDAIKLLWKVYAPTAGMVILTSACIIGANHINMRRNAALASLYTISENALREYQTKVIEKIGEAKEEKIQEELAQDKLDAHPVDDKTIIFTGKGNYLCFDAFSARYFRSDIESLRRSENLFNQKLLREGYLGINDFYDEIGLEPIELGEEMGWIAERSLLQMKFDSKLAKNNEPCLIIGYVVSPHHI